MFCEAVHQVSTIGFVGEDKAQDVDQFFKQNPVASAERTLKQSLEAIRMNTKWLERDGQAIKEWLTKSS